MFGVTLLVVTTVLSGSTKAKKLTLNGTASDAYGIARVQFKGTQFGLEDEVVFLGTNQEVQNPRTKKTQVPIAFGTPAGPFVQMASP